ncbi:MAG: hypothetical protein HC923_02010 [Myxococcales bacterium]|nr:hypothetical protein [Myxococcales bacterium]
MKVEADARLDFPRASGLPDVPRPACGARPHLPNIERITVQSRSDEGSVARIVNRWVAKAEVPSVARAVVKPEMMVWLDHAVWNQDRWEVEWRIEHATFAEQVKCGGLNRYFEDGAHTRIEIRGDLSVDAARLPGVPRLLAGTVAPVIERFIVATIRPNLVSTADGVRAYLRERPPS